MTTKKGRGRVYQIRPAAGFTNRTYAMLSSWLDELRERVYDQIEDLPADALDHKAANTNLTIGKLVLHMAYSEAFMVAGATGGTIPEELDNVLKPGTRAAINDEPAPSPGAAELIALCRRVRDEVTIPLLKDRDDPDTPCREDGSTPRGILDQMLWHWTYHSGQIGLIRFEWGSDYDWTFDGAIAPEPC